MQRATHARTGAELAVKVVQMNVQAEVRKNLIAELRTLHQSAHPHVVPYHGAFFSDGSVSILLDYMNVGSLSDVAKVLGKIPERELASVSRCVLRGLAYLHGDMRVIHRDVKPSNVLVNDAGEVKISDFGVSGQLANSVTKCNSWVGTVTYMSPERISGGTYGFDSDVWSFALSIVECALGRFPYPPPADEEAPSGASGGEGDGADAAHKPRQPMGFWDLLDHIVEEPPPTLPRGGRARFFRRVPRRHRVVSEEVAERARLRVGAAEARVVRGAPGGGVRPRRVFRGRGGEASEGKRREGVQNPKTSMRRDETRRDETRRDATRRERDGCYFIISLS